MRFLSNRHQQAYSQCDVSHGTLKISYTVLYAGEEPGGMTGAVNLHLDLTCPYVTVWISDAVPERYMLWVFAPTTVVTNLIQHINQLIIRMKCARLVWISKGR